MIIINETATLKEQCYCNPCFEMLYQRIRIILKYQSYTKDDQGQWVFYAKSDAVAPKSKEINDSMFIDPITKIITNEQLEGTYPAYSYILSSTVSRIVPDFENVTKEQIGAMMLYDLVGANVEEIVIANNWHLDVF